MKGPHFSFVVGEGDGVNKAVKFFAAGRKLLPQPFDRFGMLHVADVNRRVAQQLLHALAPILVAHDVHHSGAGLGQQPPNVKCDALAIGHAEDEDRLGRRVAESPSACVQVRGIRCPS